MRSPHNGQLGGALGCGGVGAFACVGATGGAFGGGAGGMHRLHSWVVGSFDTRPVGACQRRSLTLVFVASRSVAIFLAVSLTPFARSARMSSSDGKFGKSGVAPVPAVLI